MKTIEQIKGEELDLKIELFQNIQAIVQKGVVYENFLGKPVLTFIEDVAKYNIQQLTIHELYNLYFIIETGNANNISEKYSELANFSSHLSEAINAYLDSDAENDPTLVITLKGRSIQIPWGPEAADGLEALLNKVMDAEKELNS